LNSQILTCHNVLGTLFLFGESSQAELQRRLDVDGAAVTRQVKQLEAEELLSRRADPAPAFDKPTFWD
jgi:DNA-binding MarR family transcriptional regulator